MCLFKWLLSATILYSLLISSVQAQGSCLEHGITVCCTADHCPAQISPDGCYCDNTCSQFGDCCDDIDEVCPKESCVNDTIRLVGGANDLQGRVEVCINGVWGTVCHHQWSNTDARVVCAELGHPYGGAQGLQNAHFQQGTGPIHMDEVACNENDTSLFDCQFTDETARCNHGMDASVICGMPECTDNEIRLVGGPRESEGRVEVCLGGVWGSVCDDFWDRNDAKVVCNQLGLSTRRVLAFTGAYFGLGKGPINMDDVQCTGMESNLTDCQFNENSDCTHSEDAGVICGVEQGCIDGSIRLAGGSNDSEGRVEICVEGAWTTVCDEGWDEYAAKVICREIGLSHAGAVSLGRGYFPAGSEDVQVKFTNVTCTGHESSIMACDYDTPAYCNHSRDAGVRCLPGPAECTNKEIRLVGGADEGHGRVEVCLFQRWGTVCDHRWSTQHAEVVCRQLGLPELGANAVSGSYYGTATGPINMDDVTCTGTEANLTDCSFTSNDNCDHSNDAGVRCPCIEGDVRLAGTSSTTFGRVEVCVGGTWGTVTDDGWSSIDASVVCRQLGFWENVSFPVTSASYGQGSGPIHLDSVSCRGNEARLLDCPYDPNTNEDSHFEDAGVICFDGIGRGNCFDGAVRLVDGITSLDGRVEVCVGGEWGTVCQFGWDSQDAAVVCSQLGYPRVGTAYPGRVYSPGSGSVHMMSTSCGPTHTSLLECPFIFPFTFFCPHTNDVGVKCYKSDGCRHGEVRVNGSSTPNEGTVEVCYNGVWGSVSSVGFGENEARVVCKQLGYFKYLAIPRLNAYYGTGGDPVALYNLRCSGTEDSLVNCFSSTVPRGASHNFDAGVYCFTSFDPADGPDSVPICTLGDIRLINGDMKREGRVEVCINGGWGSVCGTGLTIQDANVVCRQLGYSSFGSIVFPDSYFPSGNENQSMPVTRLSCVGHEYQLWDCSVSATAQCSGSSVASVRCLPRECVDGDARLAGGEDDLEGRVEVCLNGTWGTVCDDFWSIQDALVICRQLGYSDEFALSYNSAFFGSNINLPILIDNLQCIGNESNVTQCPFDAHTADCSHLEDAGIKCYPTDAFVGSGNECTQGDIRLVNGSSSSEGRVELCISGVWGTVCDDRFQVVDAIVVCRQLGYSDLGATVVPGAAYGPGLDMPIHVDNSLCFGEEEKLLDCLYDPHTADCNHNKDVGVKCVPKGECSDGDVRLVNGNRPTEGRVEICEGTVWGTVASVGTAFNNAAAQVVCRQLGYSDKYVIPMPGFFGEGEGAVHAYNIVCQGDETNLLNCSHLKVPANVINPHVNDGGVRCFNSTADAPCTLGDVRVVNGSVNTSTSIDGRLEVCLDGEWGTLCGDYWIEDDSRVACNQLGYSKYAALTLPAGHYGLGNVTTSEVPVHFVPLCVGTENAIMECPLVVVDSCTHYSDSAIRCYKTVDCTEGETRLINNGVTGNEGRLEVCQHSIWGTVCEDQFSRIDARVTCRNLGYSEQYVSTYSGAYYGEGVGPIHLDNVECVGTENTILDCPYDDGIDDCSHQQDVGVACYNQSQCEHGSVRLVGGNYSYEGRVEYCLNGIWGTICDDFWDFYDAITVCIQLNLTSDHAVAYTDAYFGEGHSEIVLDNVDCVRREPTLNQCFRLTTHNCIHAQDASVACYPERQCPVEGDVRLLDGASDLEGRVEVCLNGVWGSIADDGWGENDARVVCRYLGYVDTDATAFSFAQFGRTNGRINMNRVRCSGTESSLLDCGYTTFTIFDSHFEDAGVRCYEQTTCVTGDLRLVGGANKMEGRVEVCIDGIWGTINRRGWTNQEARLVCSQLGFTDEVAFTAGFGAGTGPIALTSVDCSGEVELILNCTYSTRTVGLSHFLDAGVKCFNETDRNKTCGNGDVRLIGGSAEYEGTVEICLGGKWGSVCHFGWNVDDANVLCNQLGFSSTGNSPLYAAFFGPSSGPIFFEGVRCVGSESYLTECPVDVTPRAGCTHFQDAAVKCLPKTCEDGSIRLMDGSLPSEGRIEFCLGGTWGTVCDNAWNTPDARVVCRQLGYSDAVGTAYTHGVFGHGTGPIHLNSARCTGEELNLISCQYSTIVTQCSHGNDAGVKCYNTSGSSDVCSLGDIRLTGGGSGLMGSVEVCLDNNWGTVCDDLWNGVDSRVACVQLGYPRVSTTYRGGFFSSNATSIYLDDLRCSGTESNLFHCGYDYRTVDCTHAKDAGVQCYERDNCTEGSLRLVGGPTFHEGRVEICYNGVWGTIQGSAFTFLAWSAIEATVVCRQLGFNRTGATIGTGSYGIATGPVALAQVFCRGFEGSISECTFNTETAYLEHELDVGVKCTPPLPLCNDGDLRLRDGPVAHWGRVEVCFNETWGTITDDFWSINDGIVACRQLGYSPLVITVRYAAYFGQGTGPIYLDNLRCSGGEDRLIDCLHSTDVSRDTHLEDAGVECALTGQCTHGEIRLVNGTVPSEGRVEVCISGTWGTVNSDFWFTDNARVVCRQLGYSSRYVVPVPDAKFGEGTGLPIAMDNVFCGGSEQYLVNCSYRTFNFGDTHSEDAGVECYSETEGNCTLGEIRIVNGSTEYEGRVEVCVGGEWGTVCDQGWSLSDASVVCRQLGFAEIGAQSIVGGTFGSGDGRIFFRNLFCSGDESDILECFHSSTVGSCTHEDDAGVRCHPGDGCTDGTVRLISGGNDYEGRVEVCLGGVWGTVCQDFWSQEDAKVVCSQLGLPSSYVIPFREAYFGAGNLPIVMDNVRCGGTESNLTQCPFNRDTSDCTHKHDVGVACLSSAECVKDEMRLVNGSNGTSSGRVDVCVNGVWGSVCDNYWSTDDAKVVCSALGLPSQYVIPYHAAFFGKGSGPIFLELVQCDGTEQNLTECTHETEVVCSHAQDAGVACLSESQCEEDGAMRLVNGSGKHEGRLEVCQYGVWGTVTDDRFDDYTASVLCNILGYPIGGEALFSAAFGQGVGPIHLDNVFCYGSELSILDCYHSKDASFDFHFEDIGLKCFTTDGCEHGDVRLVDGNVANEGRIEVCLTGVWGTVYSGGYLDGQAAKVVCRQLGYSDNATLLYPRANFGEGTVPQVMSSLECNGDERNLTECEYSSFPLFTSRFFDSGVKCFNNSADDDCPLGKVRLNSTNEGLVGTNEGRVEVCIDGQWGTFCVRFLSDSIGDAICSSLGFASRGASSFMSSTKPYGSGSGPIWYRPVFCQGDADTIFDCYLTSQTSDCDHSQDVGVLCNDKECDHGELRLVDGDASNEGRVEVCEGGIWGTVCHDLWTHNDAVVMCRQLGYNSTYAQPFHYNHFTGATIPVAIDGFYCQGDESSWADCSYSTYYTFLCTHTDDAGVRCFNDVPTDGCTTGETRLMNGTSYEGRVEVCISGEWSSVCSDSWGTREAAVACNGTYGTTGIALPYKDAYFGNGTGLIQVVATQCNGNERSLLECTHSASPRDCDHSSDAGVRCIMGDECNDTGAVRLRGGSLPNEGRVEICHNGVWGTVASSLWRVREAAVVCGQLGYSSVFAERYTSAEYGPGIGVIHITFVSCSNRATDIQGCDYVSYTGRTRDHSDDVGVKCYTQEVPGFNCTLGEVRLVNGTSDLNGRVEICLISGWGTISSSYWTVAEARIACHSAGFAGPGALTIIPIPGNGTVHISTIYCNGDESSLLTCQYDNDGTNFHVDDVGVQCRPKDNCTEGEIRLNGENEMDGYVELCILSAWSTISEPFLAFFESDTICRQLGYTGSSSYYFRGSSGGPSTDLPIGLTFLLCQSDVNHVLDCSYSFSTFFVGFFGHKYDIGVTCQPEATASSTTPSASSSSSSFMATISMVKPMSSAPMVKPTSSAPMVKPISSVPMVKPTSSAPMVKPTSSNPASSTTTSTSTFKSSAVMNVSSSSVTPTPSNALDSIVTATIRGDFNTSTFPRDTFKRSVAESANQYCEGRECRKRRSVDTRQDRTAFTSDDVVIVSVTDAEGGGVVVMFYVMNRGNNNVIPADVLYEAVKRGIDQGVFKDAGFTDMTVQPVTGPTDRSKSDRMSSASKAGIALAVIIITIGILVVVVVMAILWLRRKSRSYQLDKEHILASSGSFVSQRTSVVEIDTKPVENEYEVVSKEPMTVNEKLEFKRLQEEEEDTDESKGYKSFSSSTAF